MLLDLSKRRHKIPDMRPRHNIENKILNKVTEIIF
jgi:hypothetical protein